MSVLTVYQSTCRACDVLEAGVVSILAFVGGFFGVIGSAARASNLAMSGDYEKAKKTILDN